MSSQSADLVIVGAGPVGLMCAYLARLSSLEAVVVDKSAGPLRAGRADAFNARTLQFFELVGLFDELYPLGKTCGTSSVWSDGKFISRQSVWWEELEGCFHKHFLMLGQSFLETLLDERLKLAGAPVRRITTATKVEISKNGCRTTLSSGEEIESSYVIGADGAHSFIRGFFNIPFEIVRPQIIWAVLDAIIETDFPKVPEIIVFQSETSDVAWIPREGRIDRFYVRMDTHDFTFEEVVEKINHAMRPYSMRVQETAWYSRFSVKESVAENFSVEDRVFLVGDACHVHSVNGGQGLNTGLADAFNLIWKLKQVREFGAPVALLRSYETERKPVARNVIETSGELVRATKYSMGGTHAQDYVEIVRKRAGNITGMGIRYGETGLAGTRLFDLEIYAQTAKTRLYSLLDYAQFTLLVFGEGTIAAPPSVAVRVLRISVKAGTEGYWTENSPYVNQAILVRPDAYIESSTFLREKF